uniref:Uncharacterized protein n=1 Tax=Rhizophora mucronata TaxID=61149 RepID=A0A2P2MAL4_RHIMU
MMTKNGLDICKLSSAQWKYLCGHKQYSAFSQNSFTEFQDERNHFGLMGIT